MMGWFAFFTVLVILLVYRFGEKGRADCCASLMSFAEERIRELEKELKSAREAGGSEEVPSVPFYPELAEGARFLHDTRGDLFIGQYKDTDVYAELSEHVSMEMGAKQGLPAGRAGSLLRFRCVDAKRLGVREMLSQDSIHNSIVKPDDDHAKAAAELAQKAGLVRKVTNSGGEERYVLFKPYGED